MVKNWNFKLNCWSCYDSVMILIGAEIYFSWLIVVVNWCSLFCDWLHSPVCSVPSTVCCLLTSHVFSVSSASSLSCALGLCADKTRRIRKTVDCLFKSEMWNDFALSVCQGKIEACFFSWKNLRKKLCLS